MRRLIDSTYLFSVCRCLNGLASSLDDIETFLRFVGEVLVADHLLFTVDETGPVYEPAQEAIAQLNAFGKSETFIRRFGHESINYRKVCLSAATTLAKELTFVRTERLQLSRASIEPRFSTGTSNPDEVVASLLSGLKREGTLKLPPLLKPATATHFIISQTQVVKILKTRLQEGLDFDEKSSIAFAAVIRMLIYSHMAVSLGADYLPASGRSRLHSLTQQAEHPFAQALLEKKMSTSDSPIAKAVRALVALGEGYPHSILAAAFELRSKTSGLRPYFRYEIPQDGCLIETNRLAREFKTAIDIHTGEKDFPPLLEALEPRIFLVGGLPAILIKIDKLGEWLVYKRRKRQISVVAELFTKTRKRDPLSSLERLLLCCGLEKK